MQANAKLNLFFFILLTQHLFAQTNRAVPNFQIDPIGVVNGQLSLPTVGFIYDWQTNSNALTNNFLFDINGDHIITEESKDYSAKKLSNKNYFVNQQQGGFYYVLPVKSQQGLGISIELEANSFQDATFGKGIYELVLFGNAHYKDQKKELGKVFYRNIEYQRLGLGIRKYFNNNTNCINASLNFIVGDYANQFKIDRGSVFTEENGEYIDIDLAYDRRFSAPGAAFLNPKGYGAYVNFNWTRHFIKRKSTLAINLKNVGMVRYNSHTAHQSIDTTIHFTGIDVGDISSLGTIYSINAADSFLQKFNIKSKDAAYNFSLPSLFEVRYEQGLTPRALISVQAIAYLYNALPMIRLGYFYALKKEIYLGASVRAGGYSKFDFDISGRYNSSKLYFEVSVKSLEGIIDPKHNSGLGAFAHLGFYL